MPKAVWPERITHNPFTARACTAFDLAAHPPYWYLFLLVPSSLLDLDSRAFGEAYAVDLAADDPPKYTVRRRGVEVTQISYCKPYIKSAIFYLSGSF